LTRASSWTLLKKGIELKRAVRLYWRKARYQLDERHDFILEMAPLKNARIKVREISRLLFKLTFYDIDVKFVSTFCHYFFCTF